MEFSAIQAREMYCRMMSDRINRCNQVDQQLYETYDIKRGLRNNNGTGVRVGLTKIGCVEDYRVVEGEKTPIEGNLYYRGINVKDIVNACIEENRKGYEETSYLLLFAAAAIFLIVLSFHLLGNGLRDAFDPKLRS
jgi:citrate synthase